jgi:hypothetical protein
MAPIATSKLEALLLTQREGAGVVPVGDVTFEVGAGGAPPFTAWEAKAKAPQRAAPRAMGVEYVGADGKALVKLVLDACSPVSVTPLGASGTTRIVLRCSGAKPG